MGQLSDHLLAASAGMQLQDAMLPMTKIFYLLTGIVVGFLLGHIPITPTFLWIFGIGWTLFAAVLYYTHAKVRMSRRILNDPEWAAKAMQMRRKDDAEKYPLIAAAVALNEIEASKKRTVDARHAENRDMREQVITWWEANKHTGISKDKAAEKMAGKLVPLTFRTIRDYLKGI